MEILCTGITVTPKCDTNSGAGSQNRGRDLGWEPGQVLRGKVLAQVADNTYIVNLDGKDVIVNSPYALVKNQVVAMEVQGQRDGQYMVKLLQSGAVGEDVAIKGIIEQLGMEDTGINQALIKGFLAQELPLQPKLLQQAVRMLQILGRNSPENIETVLQALKWGIPPKPRVLEVMQAFMTGLRETERGSESQVARLVQQLSEVLEGTPEGSELRGEKSVISVPPESASSLPLSKEGTALYRQVKDRLQGMILKPEEGKEKVIQQLRNLLTMQIPRPGQQGGEARAEIIVEGITGGFKEIIPDQGKTMFSAVDGAFRKLVQENTTAPGTATRMAADLEGFTEIALNKAKMISTPVDKNILPALQENSTPPGTMASVISNQENEMLSGISNTMQSVAKTPGKLPDGQNSDPLPNKFTDGQSAETVMSNKEAASEVHGKRFRAFGDFLETFSRLLQEVREAVKDAGFMQKGQRIVQEGAMIERQMAGHQIFQSLEQDSNQQNYLYFNLPFIKSGETETWGQLRIMKDTNGKKGIDPKRFSSAILLHTENLGPLLLDIKVWNREVSASGKVTEDWVAQILKKAWPKLQGSFEAMGYRLTPCEWKVGPFEENLQPCENAPQKTGWELRFLDITV